MRKARDGEATKTTVVAAAREAFAQHGFAGTSLAMISEKCGISDGLILHHFKSKENLYQAVQENLAVEYLEVITQAATDAQSPQQAALDTLRAAFQYWSNDRDYYRISLWSYLEGQDTLIEQEAVLTKVLADKVSEMQSVGQADPGFSAYALLTMTIGPLHFWMRHREMFRKALRMDLALNELNQDFQEQFIRMIMKLYQPQKKSNGLKNIEPLRK